MTFSLPRLGGTLLLGAALLSLSACDQQQMLEGSTTTMDPAASAAATTDNDTYVGIARRGSLAAAVAGVEAAGGTVTFRHEPTGFFVATGLSAGAATTLQANRAITSLHADIEIQIEEPAFVSEPFLADVIASPENPAGAFFYPRQWHLRAINAQQAWAAGKFGSRGVTVAVLDTGIGYEHADLQGLVDLDRSISFVPNDDAFVRAHFPGRHLVTDIGTHGTHVAATIASNGIAAAGVASNVTLMGVKVCSVATGGCPGSAVFSGILHAVDNGADIINMSLGGQFSRNAFGWYVEYIHNFFTYAQRNGVLVVVAAGNNARDLDRNLGNFSTYCDVSSVLCVSATGPTSRESINGPWANIDAPATYTNFGARAVDVAAPGGNTGGPVTAACSPTSLTSPICQTGTFVTAMNGTSMAAPHAAGLAALVQSERGFSGARIKHHIESTADDLGPEGIDPYYGRGRINVARALGL